MVIRNPGYVVAKLVQCDRAANVLDKELFMSNLV
jgi:hypothetical protein